MGGCAEDMKGRPPQGIPVSGLAIQSKIGIIDSGMIPSQWVVVPRDSFYEE